MQLQLICKFLQCYKKHLKCTPSTRRLEVIPFQITNSPLRLKVRIGTANIYIRPIQINLDLSTSEEFNNEVRIRYSSI